MNGEERDYGTVSPLHFSPKSEKFSGLEIGWFGFTFKKYSIDIFTYLLLNQIYLLGV